MKRMKRGIIAILVTAMMVVQLCNIAWASETKELVMPEKMGIPSNVEKAWGGYKEIPVMYDGENVNQITVYLEKTSGLDKGYATFKVKGYAYRTSGVEVHLGILFGYYATDGSWQEDFLDQAGIENLEGKYAGTEWKNSKEWSEWKDREYWTKVDSLPFTPGQEQNKGNTRVRFITATNVSGEFKNRDTSKNVKLEATSDTVIIKKDGLTVTKTATVLPNEKNVWEMSVKITGENTVVSADTEVVLVLDRSGSMGQGIKSNNHVHTEGCYKRNIICGKEKHTHTANYGMGCYNRRGELICSKEEHTHGAECMGEQKELRKDVDESYILTCTNQDPTHNHDLPGDYVSNSCYLTRADKVVKASNDFIDSLSSIESIKKLSVVTYAGTAEQVTDSNLKEGIAEVFENLGRDGTNTSSAIGMAADIISPTCENKIIVVLSDGESNKPNSYSSSTTTIAKATEVKSKGYMIYSIGAGITEDSKGANELRNCASSDEITNKKKFYLADDTSNALDTIFNEIAGEIKEAGSQCIMQESMGNEFEVVMNASLVNNGIEKTELDSIGSVDWKDKNVVYTQGNILQSDKGKVSWDIGTLTPGKPAIMKYRIYMNSGKLGVVYPITTESKMTYVDNTGANKTIVVPSISKKALWAGVRIKNYSVDEKGKETLIDTVTPTKIWVAAPDNEADASKLVVGLSTKVNASNLEVSDTGNTTIEELSKIKDIELLGIKVAEGQYQKGAKESIPNVDNEVEVGHGKIELSATLEKGYNYIQPEGVTNIGGEITFGRYTKDILYDVNLDNLYAEDTAGNSVEIVNYLDKATVRVEKLLSKDESGKKNWEKIEDSMYTVTKPKKDPEEEKDKELSITFSGTFVANENDVYRIVLYIPTKMQQDVKYNEYKNNYISGSKNELKVTAKVTGNERIKEATTIDGVFYDAEYMNVSKTMEIALNFIEIASIS